MKKIIILLSFACIGLSSCTKSPEVKLELLDVDYRINHINSNDCPVDGIPATNVRVSLRINTQNVRLTEIENQYINEAGDGGVIQFNEDEFEVSADNEIDFVWCYLFQSSDFFTETFKLTGVNTEGQIIRSEPLTATVNRPDGAN